MKKILIIPDSFKGTMTSKQICETIETTIHNSAPDITVCSVPIADGGEGTLECIKSVLDWEYIESETQGPFGEPITTSYLVSNDESKIAVIESAKAAGLSLAIGHLNPSTASTYGVGLLVKDAVLRGYKNIIVGLGGSCTNDCGAGFAAALGTIFTDANGKEFIPVGANLSKVAHINNDATEKLLEGCHITAMCDITNPLYGPNGAACIYAPQKGADSLMVANLDHNLKAFSKTIVVELSKNVACLPGAGACGGLGAGIVAFTGAELKSGINIILDIINFNSRISDFDLVFTGEGSLDEQSLKGKAVIGICQRIKELRLKTPVVAIVGTNRLDYMTTKQYGISEVVAITPTYMLYEEARRTCQTNLSNAVLRYLITHNYITPEA